MILSQVQQNTYRDASHIALMRESKGKKPVKQSQDPSADGNVKKKNMKCYYYKKKGYLKLECRKLKANQSAETVPENRRVERSKTQTAWGIEAHPQASLVVGPGLKVPDFAKC